jgi:SAM-dependent methyltransferase
MKSRTDLLNHLIQKHGLKSYLEIGVQNKSQNFNDIICYKKSCVDPDPNAKADHNCTSDDFFQLLFETEKQYDLEGINTFDLIFIDGLHTAEQVKKDFENALQVLSPNGFIVLHDCNPLEEWHTIVPRPTPTGHWNGDVYRFACAFWGYNNSTKRFTVDIDNGMMVFKNQSIPVQPQPVLHSISWQYFDQNRKELLNLISWEQFINTN